MLKRTAKVDSLKVDSAGLSSVIQIGDSTVMNSFTRALAVQRQVELFYSNEGNFGAYEIFSRAVPLTLLSEPITMHTKSLNPLIKVGSINILAISASSILHIGNSEHIQAETRTKHIRQLQSKGNNSNNSLKKEVK